MMTKEIARFKKLKKNDIAIMMIKANEDLKRKSHQRKNDSCNLVPPMIEE